MRDAEGNVLRGDIVDYSISPSIYPLPTRYFRDIDESNREFQLNLILPFKQWQGINSHFKTGFLALDKAYTFRELAPFASFSFVVGFTFIGRRASSDPDQQLRLALGALWQPRRAVCGQRVLQARALGPIKQTTGGNGRIRYRLLFTGPEKPSDH